MTRIVRRHRQTLSRATFVFALAAAIAALFVAGRHVRAASSFIPGDLVVVRMGDGSAALGSTGTAVFLDELSISGGSPLQTIAMPTAVNGANLRLVDSGSATSDGSLNRSVDGRYLSLAGYDANLGTASVASAALTRVVGRIAADGTVDTTTHLADGYSGNNFRGAVSDDGSRFWLAGAGGGGGTRLVSFGAGSSILISGVPANTRTVSIFGGQLYASSQSGAFRVATVGAGLPTTTGQTTTNLPGFPTAAGSPYAFAVLDLNPVVAGLDTLYVADDSSVANSGGIQKWTFDGVAWSLAYTLPLGAASSGGARGVTAVVDGGVVTLYATTTESSANRLVRVVDTGAGSPFTTLATAAANTAFRGVAFAPQASALAITKQPVSQTIPSGTTATLSVAASSANGLLNYQWYQGSTGDVSTPVGANSSSFTTPAIAVVTDYWVRVSNGSTTVDSTPATIMPVNLPVITTQPVSQSILTGGTATLTVVATGDAPLSYQWYVGASGDTSSPIGGATDSTFTTPALVATTSYWVQVTNPSGVASSHTATITVIVPACSVAHIPINQVQGSGETSPLVGQAVTVKGVVVGDYEGPDPALRGFYLQDLPADDDGDPATSEGVFVFESSNANAVALGQVVQVAGTVTEFQGQTELAFPTVENCGDVASVTPADVTLPVPPDAGGVAYLERFEGMLVRFHQTLFVSEHFQLGRFGQIVMSSGARLPQPTSIVAPGAAAQAVQAANNLNSIIVDDELNNQDPDPIEFGRGGNPLSASNTLRGGDSVADMVGVMTYGWSGNAASGNAYRLRPIDALGGGVPNFQPTNARPTAPPAVGGTLKVVGMNVLNYFLTLDTGSPICGPVGFQQACRGANTAQERTRQQDKLNQALIRLDADVVGMSELENTPNVDTLGDIVGRLNASLGSSVYNYVSYVGNPAEIAAGTGVIGTDDIRVGLIYKSAKVTAIGQPLVDTNPIHNRPPVAQLFSENATGERFTVVVNHFRSKGCTSPSAPNPLDNDQGDGQGCYNAKRTQQAQALLSFIQNTVLPANHDPDVMLVGDFNSYAKEDPIRAIEQAGFTNLVSRFSGASAYSYVFSAQWGYIDHALVSTSMLSQVKGAGDYHINADEPSALDYNTDFKSAGQIVSLYNADEFRIADHDPVVIGLALRASPFAAPDHFTVESGTVLTVGPGAGLLANDTGGPLSIFSHTAPAHGTLALNADGSFNYTPAPGFVGSDSFAYTVNSGSPAYNTQLFSTNLPPLATVGGVNLTAGGFGSSVYPVPGSTNEFYGLTDRGPNVDGPGGTKVEPLPAFTPAIGKFLLVGDQAVLEQVIPLQAPDGTPYTGLVNSQADTGETITDLDGNVLPHDPNGYDSEGLVALPDGTFWVSDEYGPFITHFDATGRQIGRLSPFDGSLPPELAKRLANRGMEGLTITPDGTMLVGMMQSALQQDDLLGFDAKKLTPVRIVTYRLADGDVHEYLYLLDDPSSTKTAVSEIAALSNTVFLVDERDGNFPPGAYKKLYAIDVTGATDVGPANSVPGASYDPMHGGLLLGGKTIDLFVKNLNTANSTAALAGAGITPVSKGLFIDVGGLLTSIDAQGRFFGHDKIEGVAALNGGATIVLTNDSDFGIDGLTNSAPPFMLHAKITPAGVQDDGEFLVIDLVRSDATVTIDTVDTIPPDTTLTSTPVNPANSAAASFAFTGTDSGSGVAGFECAIDGMSDADFAACASGVTYNLADGSHTFAVRAVDGAGNRDQTPASFAWTIDTVPPDTVIDAAPANPTSASVATFVFHGIDSGTGIASFSCALDAGSFAVCASGVTFGGLSNGIHTFSVRATDGAGNVDATPATYTWTVQPNRSPVAAGDAYSIKWNGPSTIAAPGVLGNDTDADHDPLTAMLVTAPTRGTVVLNPDGSFTYTPTTPNYVGLDSFTYKVSDGTATSNVVAVTLKIGSCLGPLEGLDCKSLLPITLKDSYTVNRDATLTVPPNGVLANDLRAVTALLFSGPSHGTLTFNADGGFVYTPAPGFTGTDIFRYAAVSAIGAVGEVTQETIVVTAPPAS